MADVLRRYRQDFQEESLSLSPAALYFLRGGYPVAANPVVSGAEYLLLTCVLKQKLLYIIFLSSSACFKRLLLFYEHINSCFSSIPTFFNDITPSVISVFGFSLEIRRIFILSGI